MTNRAAARKKAIAQAVLTAAALASGTSAVASGADAIETGSAANASGDFSIAIGKQANAPDPNAIALGMQASAQGNSALAAGFNADAQGDGANAVGLNAQAQGDGSLSVGVSTRALGAGATAVGLGASALNDRATAVGLNAVAQGIDSISSGSAATATDAAASAFGALATASGSASTAVGYRAQTQGGMALAGGGSALAAADRSVALGSDATASAVGAIALGSLAQATGPNANALGFGASATAAGAVALGNHANATAANSVALGANSNTTADLTQLAYAPAGLGATLIAAPDPTGEVSLGSENYERRLTKVAAGAAPTDAVNVSQLSALDGKVDAVVLGGTQRYFKADGSVDGADDAVAAGAHTLAAGAGASATAADAAAVGAGARSDGIGSAAFGANAMADAGHATSIGAGAVAGEANATSIGASAMAGGSNATAIGAYSAVIGDGSIALGYSASVSADNAIALGRNSVADRANTVSVGAAGQERQLTNVAAGTAATDAVNLSQLDAAAATASRYFKVHGGDPTANSDAASATGNDAIAIGNSAFGAGESGIAAGSGSLARGDFSAAIGAHAVAAGDGSAALGYNANAAAAGSLALGYNASTVAAGSVALGEGSIADRAGTVSVGSVGHERQITNVAAGTADSDAVNVAQLKTVSDRSEANAARLDGVLAYDQNADGSFNRHSVTLGGDAASGGTVIHNVATGTTDTDAVNVAQLKTVSDQGEANATKIDGALIYDRNADGSVNRDGVTLGGSVASGGTMIHNVAAGTAGTDAVNVAQLKTVSDQGVANTTKIDGALMYDRNADGSVNRDGVTLGGSVASGGTVIHNVAAGTAGNDAVNVAQLKTVSDQGEANATKIDSALLYDRNADGSVNRDDVTLGGSVANGGTVIHNVAAGTAGNDAVNVAQLKTVSDQGEANATKIDSALLYDRNADGSVNRDGVTLGGNVASGGTTIHNVAAGTAGTDAVNVAQLKTVSDQGEANATKIDGALMYDRNADGSVNRDGVTLGGNVANGGTTIHNVAAGTAGTDAVNVAQLKTVSDQGEVNTTRLDGALMYDRNADGTINRDSFTLAGNASSGGTVIHNVAAGTADTDATNVAQLKAVSDQSEANTAKLDGALMYDRNSDGSIDRHNITLGDNTGSGGTSIHNVVAGTADTDAVNVAQLKTVSDQSEANTAKLNGALMYDRNADGTIDRDSFTLGGSAANGGTVIHNVAPGIANTDAVNVAQLKAVSDQSEANTVKLDGALIYDRNADGTINRNSFTLAGSAASGGTVIHNVAPGTADTDAVNLAQLKTVSDQSEANTAKLDGALMYDKNADGTINRNSLTLGGDASSGGTVIHNVADGVDVSDAVNLGQLNAVVNGAVNNAVVTAANPFISAEGDRNIEGAVSSGSHSLAAGANARATGAGAAAIGANAIAGGNDATALGATANASADNSIALGHGSIADRANAVSIGSAGQERQIINVAAGVHGTDAVNVNQLQQSVGGAITQANHYTDDQIRSARRDGYGGTASALAIAGLPQVALPGHGMFAMAGGTYGGQSALAIGVSQLSEKGTWIYKLQGTTDSRGQLGASIGAGVHW